MTDDDNEMLETIPSKTEVLESLTSSNLNVSAGSDGLTGLFYKECWDSLGDSLTEVIRELFVAKSPSVSMRTAMMIFSAKPSKASSIRPEHKRRISILNTDVKTYEKVRKSRVYNGAFRNDIPEYSYPT